MSLDNLLREGKLTKLPFDKGETKNLLEIVDRDIKSSVDAPNTDWQVMICYNAGLALCNLLIRYNNYRVKGSDHHKTSINAAKILMNDKNLDDYFDLLDRVRRKRNNMTYNQVNLSTEMEFKNLHENTIKAQSYIVELLK